MNTPCSVLSALYVVGFSFELEGEDDVVGAFGMSYKWVWWWLMMDVNKSR